MSRIKKALAGKKSLIGFLTAGDPTIEKTKEYIIAMARAGADLIEIGIPFSDPIAEGEVIQEANVRALRSKTTVDKVFKMVESVRASSDIPLVFLTYLNPVLNYGYERFFLRCNESGIDGIIIPDLPFEERGELSDYTEKNGIDLISMVAPTSRERIDDIARSAKGFIYLVSSMGVTGVRSEIKTDLRAMTDMIRQVCGLPVCVGFGISTIEQARDVCEYADGVIIGSAIVKIIERCGFDAAEELSEFISRIKRGM